jgi:2-oxoacid:acceptor oxidoreductase gamma subunit (pyruvate/2-ketoisovalerate family)/2-oxoacid:acceptor oxidoreductase delta subunit (pyruvate/2-ketoisovalerate family)
MNMYEIRFHGRGGQGAVMAAQTMAEAAILEGKQAQAFPFFGAERRGAPVMAFARIDDKRICDRTQVSEPDMLVVMDESLLEIEPVASGLKKGGCAVVNSALAPSEIDLGVVTRCVSVDATSIALEMLRAPIVNTSILGAMARADDFVKLESIQQAIMNRFGEKLGEKAGRLNAEAAKAAYDRSREGTCKGGRKVQKKNAWLPTWQETPPGVALPKTTKAGMAVGPGSMTQNLTGSWGVSNPIYDDSKCIKCQRCWFICPEGCVRRSDDGALQFDIRYCKGCGLCAKVCPKDAIQMKRKGAKA